MINIIYSSGKWKVKRAGAKRADSVHSQERLALMRAKWIAKGESIFVHDRTGAVRKVIG